MLTVTAAAPGTLLSAAAGAPSGPGWWDVVSGLLLAAAGAWATWAQFIYPKIAERKARSTGGAATPVAATPAAAPTDLVGVMFRDQAQRLDDILDQLEAAHRKHARDAGDKARLTAELAEARRLTCYHLHPGGPP